MVRDEQVEVVQRVFDAFSDRDIEAATDFVAADLELFLVTAVAKVVNVWSPRGWREKVHPPGMASAPDEGTTVNAKPPSTEE